jgi:mono/diheme cytochrome c family protein
MNPPVWSQKAYENVWKQWGLDRKPAAFAGAFRNRYGLHRAPYENNGLPMGLHEASGLLGKGIANDCLLCHAGTIAGQTYIGLGNASMDLQGLYEELSAVEGLPIKVPFKFSHTRGTIDPVAPAGFLMAMREPDLNLRDKPVKLDVCNDASSDPPAWWLLKKKKTRDWTAPIDARSARIDMVNLLSPFNSAEYIQQQEPIFKDIHTFLLSVEAPRYPFPINRKLAARGQDLFTQTCAKCHGTYGPSPTYPNKIVPLGVIGTDRILADAITQEQVEYTNQSWFAKEVGPDGQLFQLEHHRGYQAPPLDGIWATAPYFHNGSVPTVYHVLQSKARPRFFTRSFRTEKDDYDPGKLGWKITVLERGPDPKLPGVERRRIYDTTRPGLGNGGHTFGDDFSEEERMAVIEYLKTL